MNDGRKRSKKPVGKVPARIAWAVELLDVAPDDHILEIGCGPGVAAALICERLDGGRLTAIDRSATAIERARGRNADHLAAGRLFLEQTDLAGFRGDPEQFDQAFAVHVNVFWTTDADPECAVLKRVLRPGGVLRLVYEGPTPGSQRNVAPEISANLERHGFSTDVVPGPGEMMFGITARMDG